MTSPTVVVASSSRVRAIPQPWSQAMSWWKIASTQAFVREKSFGSSREASVRLASRRLEPPSGWRTHHLYQSPVFNSGIASALAKRRAGNGESNHELGYWWAPNMLKGAPYSSVLKTVAKRAARSMAVYESDWHRARRVSLRQSQWSRSPRWSRD